MLLSDLLLSLDKMAKDNNISAPYVVGGMPRDKMFGLADSIRDIDITTGNKESIILAVSANKEWPDVDFRTYDDGHSSIDFKNIRLDFSNNFILPGIEDMLKEIGIEKPSDLEKEMYSRDFTINTILQPMNLEEDPIDITKKAFDDVKNKILRTPVNPEFTIGYDPRRILRAVKLIIKFDLKVEENVKEAIIKYRGSVIGLSSKYVKGQINQMLKMNSDKTIELLTEFQLLPIIPLSKMMILETTKRHMVQNLLDSMEL